MVAAVGDVGLAPGRAAEGRSATLRVALVTGALVVALLASLLARAPSSAPTSRGSAPPAVTLAHGETLWELAVRYAPSDIDRRAYVDELVALNRLEGPPLAGQRIHLPR